MKIVIVGYGRMGKIVESQALEKGYKIVKIISPELKTKKEDLIGLDFDVIIEFSISSVVFENIEFYAKNNFKVVIATTGWYDKLDEVKNMFKYSNGALLWSGNFSIGVLIFLEIIKSGAKMINKFENYDVFGHEFHHSKKADSPSGTAFLIANVLLENIDRKKELLTKELIDRPIKKEELHFSSTRGGSIPGTHSVYFDSIVDTIEIKHTARNREGFALGSLVCAQWLKNKKGYFEINDFVKEVL